MVAAACTAEPVAQRGRQLMTQYQCAACHRVPGVAGGPGVLGPDLTAYSARSYIAGQWPNDAAHLSAWIVDPPSLLPGTRMPALGVSADDANAMAAYLATLR
jgi:cytochrome c